MLISTLGLVYPQRFQILINWNLMTAENYFEVLFV